MLLDKHAVTERLAELPHWSLGDNEIVCRHVFHSFMDGIAFVNQVAALAEEANHHPDIHVAYTNITLNLATHSAGGLTAKDFDLAAKIEALFEP